MRAPVPALLLAVVLPGAGRAQFPGGAVRIGVLNDMLWIFADLSGEGSVVAAQMAADDFAKEAGPDAPRVKIFGADHQNNADVGAAIARRWVDQDGVAAVVDVPNSAVALAVNQVMREKDRTFLASDYAFGAFLVRDAGALVRASGGRVVGDVRMPLGTPDMSSYLLQAQASGAQVIGLAAAGDDVTNLVKRAAEFGMGRGGKQRLAGLLVFLTDVNSMGLETVQGLLLTEAFYWDLNDATRAWSQRFAERTGGRKPTMNHAGVYSSVLAYLRAAAAVRSVSGQAVVAKMEEAPINDALFGPTTIRRDGRRGPPQRHAGAGRAADADRHAAFLAHGAGHGMALGHRLDQHVDAAELGLAVPHRHAVADDGSPVKHGRGLTAHMVNGSTARAWWLGDGVDVRPGHVDGAVQRTLAVHWTKVGGRRLGSGHQARPACSPA